MKPKNKKGWSPKFDNSFKRMESELTRQFNNPRLKSKDRPLLLAKLKQVQQDVKESDARCKASEQIRPTFRTLHDLFNKKYNTIYNLGI